MRTTPSPPVRRAPLMRLLVIAAAGPGLVAAACVTDLPGPDRTVWEATLVAADPLSTGSGTAAAVSNANMTQASISVSGLDAGTYTWGVFRGDCESPGDLMGGADLYPELAASTGSATAEAFFSLHMDSNRSYAALAMDEGGAAVVCGAFEEWE